MDADIINVNLLLYEQREYETQSHKTFCLVQKTKFCLIFLLRVCEDQLCSLQ